MSWWSCFGGGPEHQSFIALIIFTRTQLLVNKSSLCGEISGPTALPGLRANFPRAQQQREGEFSGISPADIFTTLLNPLQVMWKQVEIVKNYKLMRLLWHGHQGWWPTLILRQFAGEL